jgi:adenine-specific DNA-methyltransferase
MSKLKMHSPNLVDKNIEKIAEIFPNCITEVKGENEEIVKAIDFELLQQELSDVLAEGSQERYRLDWPGKKESILVANSPIAKTLRPAREESVNFDTTENLFIEGDNLDALKLLQENYLGKVKMIYIDPPYNTGNDFIYEDDFAESTEEFFERSNQVSEEGERLIANPESNGRFHSDWLSMMYSRLRLARNLLSEDGVIFVSIDDGEQANIRKVCDEIFGEDNFLQNIIWKKRSGAPNDRVIGSVHEYVLLYTKNSQVINLNWKKRSEAQLKRYKNPDAHPKGRWAPDNLMANVKGGRFVKSLYFPIVNPNTGEEHYPSSNGNWRYNQATIQKLLDNDEIYFGVGGTGRPQLKRFLCDIKSGVSRPTIWDWVGYGNNGSKQIQELLGNLNIFDTPKSLELLKEIVGFATSNDEMVLDFFAGSSTTAHAVMSLNAEDGGNRKFIMVQLPEATDENSTAHQAGYSTIAEISKERIRRAGQKILEEHADKEGIENLDIGFRVLKVDSSNMTDVYYKPAEYKQEDLLDLADNIKADRSAEDLLFQVMLDWGLELSLPIETKQIDNKEVFYVLDNTLIACFDNLTDELVNAIAQDAPLRFVSAEKFIQADHDKTNIIERFKQLSPNTEVKFI